MPTAPKKPCRNARNGCGALVVDGGFCPGCAEQAATINARADTARRGTAAQRGYDWRWQKRAERVRREEPLCRRCSTDARPVPTDVADHIKPKRYGGTDHRSNLQGLCAACNSQKAIEDRAKYEQP